MEYSEWISKEHKKPVGAQTTFIELIVILYWNNRYCPNFSWTEVYLFVFVLFW